MKSKDLIVLQKILDYRSVWDTITKDLLDLEKEIRRIVEQMDS